MKTAISIPDPLFKEGEKLAKKLKITRSDLYQEALHKYVEYHNEKQILEKLNSVYDNNSNTLDIAFRANQKRLLTQNDWA